MLNSSKAWCFAGTWSLVLTASLACFATAGPVHAASDVAVWCSNDTRGRSASVSAACVLRSRTQAKLEPDSLSIKAASGSAVNFDYVDFDREESTSVVLFLLQQGGKSHPNDSAREINKLIEYAGKRQFGFYTFYDDIEKLAPVGSDQATVQSALDARRYRKPDTKLFTAINTALDDLAAVAATRRTLVVVGDGSSGRERLYEDQIVQKSLQLDIPIFTIAFTDNRSDQSIQSGLTTLRTLASETGGVFEDAGPSRTVTSDFETNFYHYVENGGEAELTSTGITAGNRLDFDVRLSNGRPITLTNIPVRTSIGEVTSEVVPVATPASSGSNDTSQPGTISTSSSDNASTSETTLAANDDTSTSSDGASETADNDSDSETDTSSNDNETASDEDQEETVGLLDDPVAWAKDNPFPAISALVAILGLGALAFMVVLRPRAPSEHFDEPDYDGYAAQQFDSDPAMVAPASGGGLEETVMMGGGSAAGSEDVVVPSDFEVTVPDTSPQQTIDRAAQARTRQSSDRPHTGSHGHKVFAYLEFIDSDSTRAPIASTNVRIGRHRDNDVCISNHSVHRQHAVIFRDAEGDFQIKDLGTKNGVIVNNVRSSQTILNDGDVIELGEVKLRYSVAGEK